MISNKISVIIPIYHVEPYLEECLESVINQTHLNLDIVLVEDGGSDESLEIAKKYVKKDKRIFLITKPNGGLSSARNMGLELIEGTMLRNLLEEIDFKEVEKLLAGGGSNNLDYLDNYPFLDSLKSKILLQKIIKHFKKINDRFYACDLLFIDSLITQELPQRWIHFLDSDDYLRLDCLQKCLEAKDKKPNLEIINHKIDIFNQFSNSFIKVRNLESKKTYYESGLEYLVDNHFYMFCFVFRGMFSSSILNRYSLRFTNKIFHEDCDFGTILFALSNGVLIEDFRGLVYRQRKGSIMAGYRESSFPPSMPSNLEPLRPYFKNYKDLREYFRAYSSLVMAVNLMKFQNFYPLDRRAKKLFEKSKRSYICNYIHNYSNLNILPAENLLRDLGITNLKRYRRIDIFFRPRTAARKILKNILKFLKKEG